MTHEPECPAKEFPYFCACVEIQDAYQRGREDAAEGIRNFYFGQRWPDYANPDDIVHQLIAAARGDGEQA